MIVWIPAVRIIWRVKKDEQKNMYVFVNGHIMKSNYFYGIRGHLAFACLSVSAYANNIGPSVMIHANELEPVKGSLYVMTKLLKMTVVS